MFKADLHIHSNYSDGSDSIRELVDNLQNAGIEVFALTDHDTVAGCAEINQILPSNIKFIPSVELTCKADDIKCHILGYNCDYKNPILTNLIEKGKVLRKNKLETRIKYLKDFWNIELNDEELNWLYSRKSVVKTHIANVLVKRGLASNNLDAMAKYLDGCKSGDTRFSIEEAIDAIISAGGIPIWAHPIGGEGEEHISEEEFLSKLDKMIKYGIKGLECYYSRYNEAEINFLVQSANKFGLLISGGSDYHGTNKDIPLLKLNVERYNIGSDKLTVLNAIQ